MNSRMDNKGFSLVELIVVVLIIAIIATGAAMSLSVVYNADAERAARNLTTVFNSARTRAMALNESGTTDVTVIIGQDEATEDYYIRVYDKNPGPTDTPITEKLLGNYKISIFAGTTGSDKNTLKCDIGGSVDCKEVNKDGTLKLLKYSFKKSTGGINIAGTESERYLDIIIAGSERFKIVVSDISGKCYIAD